MSILPARPRKGCSAYFWLMVWLLVLPAVGLFLLIAGIATGLPPFLAPPALFSA